MFFSKRKNNDVKSDPDDTNDEKRRIKKSKAVQKKDKTLPHLSESQQHDVLIKDPWVCQAEPKCVQCSGCKRWIALHSEDKHQYELHNWEVHHEKCPHITGVQNK
jgi:hypothetical protein